MTDDTLVLTPAEVAAILRVSESVVRRMVRDRRLARVAPQRPMRILRRSVDALLEDYHAPDEPHGEASTQAPPPGRGHRRAPAGSLAGEAMGGSGALSRRIGAAAADVVVRRVTG